MTRTTEQVLADQAKQAEAQRLAALAEPIPEGLCWLHAQQHRRFGWHDMRPCNRCRRVHAHRQQGHSRPRETARQPATEPRGPTPNAG